MKLWQLKNLKTGVALNDPQKLPENWGPIFGLYGLIDKIGDLSWLGEAYADLGWVSIGDGPDEPVASAADIAWNRAKDFLKDSDWSMLPDVPMTVRKKSEWIEYRKALREIRGQTGFPNDIQWPVKPE